MHTMLPRMPQPVAVLCSQMLPFSLALTVFPFFRFFHSTLTAPGRHLAGRLLGEKIYGRESNEMFWRFQVIAEIERQMTVGVTGKLIEGNAMWYYRTFAYIRINMLLCAQCAHSVLDPGLFTLNPLNATGRAEHTQITHTHSCRVQPRSVNKPGRSLMAWSSHWHGCKSSLGSSSVFNCCSTKCIEACRSSLIGLRWEGEYHLINLPPNRQHTRLIEFDSDDWQFFVYHANIIFTFMNMQTYRVHSRIHALCLQIAAK